MNWVIDIAIVIVFCAIVFAFSWYGFAKSLSKLGKTWLPIICALAIGPLITGWLEQAFLDGAITSGVHSILVKYIESNANGYNIAQIFESFPQGLKDILHVLNADLATLEVEFGSYAEASNEILWTMSERIANPVISIISTVIGMLLGFIVPWLVMKILARWVDRSDRNKFMEFCDHTAGVAIGIAAGYVASFLLCLLVKTCFQLVVIFDASVSIMNIYDKSLLFKFICETNILMFFQ